MIPKATINLINRAACKVSSPNMARNMVGSLIVINGVMRATACEMDTSVKPAERHYGAAVESLHEGFAFVTQFATLPLFAIGGLLLGKHFMAKSAFKDIATKVNLKPEQTEFMHKYAKKASGRIGKFFGKMYAKVGEFCKVANVVKGINKINEYNQTVLKEVRKALNPAKGTVKEIIIQKGIKILFQLRQKF